MEKIHSRVKSIFRLFLIHELPCTLFWIALLITTLGGIDTEKMRHFFKVCIFAFIAFPSVICIIPAIIARRIDPKSSAEAGSYRAFVVISSVIAVLRGAVYVFFALDGGMAAARIVFAALALYTLISVIYALNAASKIMAELAEEEWRQSVRKK